MTKLTYPVLFASLALAYGHALAVDTSVPKAEDYEAVPESEMPKQPKDDQTGKLKPKFPVKIDTQDSEIKEMLEEYLPLITQQQEEELDKEQVGFLAEEAPDNVKTMLRTKRLLQQQRQYSRPRRELHRQRHPWPAYQSRQRQRGHPRRRIE